MNPDRGIFVCHSLELPWKENKRNVSCIPPGNYLCSAYHSPKFGQRYLVRNVPDRDGILIHAGNMAGDEAEGLKSDVEGCILLGMSIGTLGTQRAVLSSKVALERFEGFFGFEDFQLNVRWADGSH